MPHSASARHLYDFAYHSFRTEVALLKDHRKRFEVKMPGKKSTSSRDSRWSIVALLPIQTVPTSDMRVAYAGLKIARDDYLAAMDARLRLEQMNQRSAMLAQSTAERRRLRSPTAEDWRRRHLGLLSEIQTFESEFAAMDVLIEFMTSQISYLIEEAQRAHEVYEQVRGFPHKTFLSVFETSAQDDDNIRDALQHKTRIEQLLVATRASLWQEIDKRKCRPPELQAYIETVQMHLKQEVRYTGYAATEEEMADCEVREAKAAHHVTTFIHEQATAAHDRAFRLLVDLEAILKIEISPATRGCNSATAASNYVGLLKVRARQTEENLRRAKINFQISANALRLAEEACTSNATKTQPRTKPSIIRTPTKRLPTAAEWRQTAEQALSDYASIITFPEPPEVPCSREKCITRRHTRALKVCDCAVRAAFAQVGDLKRERTRWHPDKWSCCHAAKREMFEKKAAEIFIVLDAMYKEGSYKARR